MGVAQLERLDEYVTRKREHAMRYTAAIADIPGLEPPPEASYAHCTYWLYTVLVDEAQFGMTSRALLARFAERNIQTRPLWQPMHRSPAQHGARAVGGQVADRLCRDALSLPSSVGLSESELTTVIGALQEFHAK